MPFPSSPFPTRSSPLPPHPAAFRFSRCPPRCRRRSNGGEGLTYHPSASASTGPAGRGARETRGAHSSARWLPALLAAAVVLSFSSSSSAHALLLASTPPPEDATFEDVPQTLSGGAGSPPKKRIQKPKSREAERCTSKCVGTCIQGGAGSPGEGPFNVRRPLVVFKSGFRSRNYWQVFLTSLPLGSLARSLSLSITALSTMLDMAFPAGKKLDSHGSFTEAILSLQFDQLGSSSSPNPNGVGEKCAPSSSLPLLIYHFLDYSFCIELSGFITFDELCALKFS
ncbi:hypothetical protein Taro_052268 [Colocasia esculenta]|uniref:Uncharacterized protein n=1 Tax=Colocasia esculenta TaxID=4460 RepID=A0A843XIV1_COLES|nr:hypothetical protein [Colocasia esculenta]